MKLNKIFLAIFFSILICMTSIPVSVSGSASFSIGDKLVVDILNDLIEIILSYLGQISLVILIIGGILYVISGSNPQAQEKAKKTIQYALFGLALALISYAILGIIHSIVV